MRQPEFARRQGKRKIRIKTPEEAALMREAGRIVAEVMQAMQEHVRPGVSTGELDALAEAMIGDLGAVPSFKGYHGFPASICTSVNDELVHGIPQGTYILQDGDIVSIDVGTIYKGWQGDSAWTFPVGAISEEVRHLLETTEGSLYAGIAQARSGSYLTKISAAVQDFVESRGLAIVRKYTGHGIGQEMHEAPQILNYVPDGSNDSGLKLVPGMTLALEPMVQMGTWQTRELADGWTVASDDGSISAHFEHTVLITDDDPEILTIL